jgi:hypothetical protein
MTDVLARECSTFARYLSGAEPSDYVLAQYRAAHAAGVVELADMTNFDRAVVAIARRGPALARAMDAHARVFASGSLLRRKLVLMLALLETKSPPADSLDAPEPGSTAGMFLRMSWLAALFALTVAASAVALLPVRVASAVRGGR